MLHREAGPPPDLEKGEVFVGVKKGWESLPR